MKVRILLPALENRMKIEMKVEEFKKRFGLGDAADIAGS